MRVSVSARTMTEVDSRLCTFCTIFKRSIVTLITSSRLQRCQWITIWTGWNLELNLPPVQSSRPESRRRFDSMCLLGLLTFRQLNHHCESGRTSDQRKCQWDYLLVLQPLLTPRTGSNPPAQHSGPKVLNGQIYLVFGGGLLVRATMADASMATARRPKTAVRREHCILREGCEFFSVEK